MKTAQMNVELLDYLGTDLTVVNAARVSFDKTSDWEVVTTEVPEDMKAALVKSGRWKDTLKHHSQCLPSKDAKLIKYLADHNHWTPFSHPQITLRIKAPIFVARQWFKHMVGITRNETSRRYVDEEPEFYFPEVWRGRPEGSIKQGSSGVVSVPEGRVETVVEDCLVLYEYLIHHDNVAPEQARMVLPQNMMTEWIETASLAAICRACKQRLDPHAQLETREIAERIAEIVAPLFPVSWSALMGEA